jgi:hypothetical protein
MSDQPKLPSPNQSEDAQAWLKELATRSWEPELIISGAAIYLTSGLPEWIDAGFNFYELHLAPGYHTDFKGSGTETLATLGLLFFKCGAYLLTSAFVVHFTLRAFWVAMLGLLSVYPQDIDYQQVRRVNEYGKQYLAGALGTFQAFTVRLDRLCSTFLSVAFYLALVLGNIAFIYLAMFTLLSLVRLVVPAPVMERYDTVLYFAFVSLTMLPALFLGLANLRWAKESPKLQARFFHWQWAATGVLFPFSRDAFTRLGYMFQTNVPRRTFGRYQVAFGVLLAITLIGLLVQRVGSRLDSRTYFGTDEAFRAYPVHYDNLRPKGELIRTASIQAEVVRDGYLRLFIAYPKSLDPIIEPRCPEPVVPDSVPLEQARAIRNRTNLACFGRYFRVYVNDSLQRDLAYVWHVHPNAGERGLLTYVPVRGLRPGANQLRLAEPKPDSAGRERRVAAIPFWYLP